MCWNSHLYQLYNFNQKKKSLNKYCCVKEDRYSVYDEFTKRWNIHIWYWKIIYIILLRYPDVNVWDKHRKTALFYEDVANCWYCVLQIQNFVLIVLVMLVIVSNASTKKVFFSFNSLFKVRVGNVDNHATDRTYICF